MAEILVQQTSCSGSPFSSHSSQSYSFKVMSRLGWWLSSPHYIMFLRTSTLQREEKKCIFSRPILLGRQTASILVCTEACCSYLLTEPSPKTSLSCSQSVLFLKNGLSGRTVWNVLSPSSHFQKVGNV